MAKKTRSAEPVEEVPQEEQGEAEAVSTGRRFRVEHLGISGPVNPFRQGEIIDEANLQYNDDVDIDRLLRLGAIVEISPEDLPAEMEHPENQPFVDSSGRVVDAPGFDRPTIQHDVRTGVVKAMSARERLAAVQGSATPGRTDEAVREQQLVQRNLRAGGTVRPEVAEAQAQGEVEEAAELDAAARDEELQADVEADPVSGEEIPEELQRPAAAVPTKVRRAR